MLSPSASLLTATTAALRRAPCLVSFSGGHDSSLVLAAATHQARRDGLPDPIPITWRATDAPASHESDWQEAVIAELGLRDWVRLDAGDDLDYVGPVATSVADRHGVLYPANVHLHDPLLARARGGSLLTGVGGDQLFGTSRWARSAAILRGRARPSARDLRQVGLSLAPPAVRRVIGGRRLGDAPTLPWLTSTAQRAFAQAVAADGAAEPVTWPKRVAWQLGRPSMLRGLENLGRLASDHDCQLAHPLLDAAVVRAVATAGGRFGFDSRREALAELFPTLQPAALTSRHTKANFSEVFTRTSSLELAGRWDGAGIWTDIVDVEALRVVWQQQVPFRSAMLLQQVALQGRLRGGAPR